MRKASVKRKTKETSIQVSLNLDGAAKVKVSTGIAFLDHMITALATHGLLDLTLVAKGDLHIDLHHTNEDIGLALGEAVDKALAKREGIQRMGFFYVPMDEALVRVAIDFSGRGKFILRDDRPSRHKSLPMNSSASYQWGDAKHFLESFSRTARMTLHVNILAGEDFHHTLEATFKALGRSIAAAVSVSKRVRGVPSSKGSL